MAMVAISMFIAIYAVQSLYAGEKRAP